jgi:hypothetical protein
MVKGRGSEFTTAKEETNAIVGLTAFSAVAAFIVGSLTHEYKTVWQHPSRAH